MNKDSVDPYVKYRTEYELQMNNANASKQNWQRFCLLLTVVLMMSVGINFYTINRSHVIPYVVQVDDLGRALSVTEAKPTPLNDEKIIKAFVYQYIDMSRSVVSDPEIIKKNLHQVYQNSIKSVQNNFLDIFYKAENPFDYMKDKGTKYVEPTVFLRQAENTYSVEWREIERNYENQVLSESRYKALITVVQVPPNTEDDYQKNPLNPFGLYVTSVSWSKLM